MKKRRAKTATHLSAMPCHRMPKPCPSRSARCVNMQSDYDTGKDVRGVDFLSRQRANRHIAGLGHTAAGEGWLGSLVRRHVSTTTPMIMTAIETHPLRLSSRKRNVVSVRINSSRNLINP